MKTKVPNSFKNFWAKVETHGAAECWPWRGAINNKGYGNVKWEGRYTPAHRVAYALTYGAFPPKAWVLHKCDNPPCCNPDHLFLGNAKMNSEDAVAKGRMAQKERHGRRKLGQAQVNAIRELHELGWIGRDIARAFSVSFALVSLIINNKVWTI